MSQPSEAAIEEHIQALKKVSEKFEPVYSSKRLEDYYVNLQQMWIQGKQLFKCGDFSQAYVYLRRFALVTLNEMPKHNAYHHKNYQKRQNWSKKTCGDAMDMADKCVAAFRQGDLGQEDGDDASSGRLRTGSGGGVVLPPAAPKTAPLLPGGIHIPAAPTTMPVGYPSSLVGAPGAMCGGTHGVLPSDVTCTPLDQVSTTPLHAIDFSDSGSDGEVPDYLRGPGGGPGSSSSAAGGMRPMHVPTGIVESFLRIAAPNSNRPPNGVETCGILCGNASKRGLTMTHLIIPKQQATSDTVAMTHEEDLFMVCMDKDLIILGWIHTHPSQSCFLSSVDLHTHCGFQTQLDEAIAIVLAPKDRRKTVGVFRLHHPDPPGLKTIQKCPLRGFHQHDTSFPIYHEVNHVTFNHGRFETIDMR
eukprot:g5935.t1